MKNPTLGLFDVNFLRNSHYSRKHAHIRNSRRRIKSFVAEFWSMKILEGQNIQFKGLEIKEALSWIFGGLFEDHQGRNSSPHVFL